MAAELHKQGAAPQLYDRNEACVSLVETALLVMDLRGTRVPQ